MPDMTGSNDYLTDVSPQDKPWDKHRSAAVEIERTYRQTENFQKLAERMARCSLLLDFVQKAGEDGKLKLHLTGAFFCRVRHCPICQWRRSLMWRARMFKAIPRIMEEYPSDRWIFLTLTIRNCPLVELRATIRHMNKSWERLSKRKQFPARAWIRSVEVTRGDDDTAHPHFHCLLLVPSSYFSHGYVTQAEWAELWRQAARLDYAPIVDVKAVKNRRRRAGDRTPQEWNAGIADAVLETLKYSVKPEDIIGERLLTQGMSGAQWLDELTAQLGNTRAVSVGGELRHFIADEEPEDLINGEDVELELTPDEHRLWFGWREMVRRYRKVEQP